MEDSKKLKEFLSKAPIEKIKKLIEKLESINDDELNDYAEFLKSLIG